MHEVMDNNALRTVHRKYIVMFHPDKVAPSNDSNKIYIANRVFTAINDAYNLFKKENGIK
jgi:preprotein translocase subunit Sec63